MSTNVYVICIDCVHIHVALSGQQTLVELHASRTNEDVRMYIEEYLF